jgi:RNA polymerase sigma-70 factor (ECF subfamily)
MKLQEFERVYDELSPKVFNVAYRMTGSLEDAQDVLQDVFMKVWKHHKGFRGEAKLSTWIYRIAVNTAISLIRKRKPTKPIEDFEYMPADTKPFDPRIIKVEKAIQRLPEGEKKVFILHDVEGFTHEEIGEILDISPGTSKSQLHKARKKLQEMLKGKVHVGQLES